MANQNQIKRTSAETTPISVAFARNWLKLDDAEPDDIIDMALAAAIQKAEHTTGCLFSRQTWQADVAMGESIGLLGLFPIVSITQGAVTTLPSALDLNMTVTAQSAAPIVVVCGYDVVPQPVQMWVLQRAGFWLENRQSLGSGAVFEPPRDFVDGLLDPFIRPHL